MVSTRIFANALALTCAILHVACAIFVRLLSGAYWGYVRIAV